MKKNISKILAVALSVIMLMCVLPFAVSAAEYYTVTYKDKDTGIIYFLTNEKSGLSNITTAKVTGYDSSIISKDVKIDPYFDYQNGKVYGFWEKRTFTVTAIDYEAFEDYTGLESITIPNSVTSIGNSAFSGCTSLTSITILNSVTSIGSSAFSGCTALTSITIPDSVTSIGDYAFYQSGLTSVKISNKITSISSGMFRECAGLKNVIIPDSVNAINESAFYKTGLTDVTIPNSVKSIGEWAFGYCEGLKNVTIGDSVTSIGNKAFYYCNKLTKITIPSSVISIGDSAFYYCSSLNDVYYLGTEAQWKKISIGVNNDCLLKNANIYYNVKRGYCGGESGGKNLSWILDGTGTLIILGSGKMGDWGYNLSPWNAYKSSIKTLIIENGVTTIGDYAFYSCSNLTNITIPSTVTSIGMSAFHGCTALKSVKIPDSVTTIYEEAFADCTALQSIELGKNLKEIYGGIVSPSSNLQVIIDKDNPYFTVEGKVITNKDKTKLVLYFGNDTDYTIPEGITEIGSYAFYKCYNLKKLRLSNSIEEIDENAIFFSPSVGTNNSYINGIKICCHEGSNAAEYIAGKKWTNVVIEPHAYGEWVNSKAVYCTEPHPQTRTCEICGHVEERMDRSQITQHDYDWRTIKEATFLFSGEREMYCKKCGYVDPNKEKIPSKIAQFFINIREIFENLFGGN